MGFVDNISRDTTGANSIVAQIVNEIEIYVAVVETKINSLPFDKK